MPETLAVLHALTADGATVRFVGGCVRDALAGRPVVDIDIATPDPPAIAQRLLEDRGIRVIPTGIDHGTITAISDGHHYEVTTLRVDVETDGRRATVAFTDDWTADAARRDLTINAISASADGTLYDPFDGVADLKAGRVRFVGEAELRIREDVLRLLRFFRFYAHYGRPPPDPEGLAACRALADLLPTLSGERVRAELFKLLGAATAPEVLALMAEQGVLANVLPEATDFSRLGGLLQVEEASGVEPRPVRRLAALLPADPDSIDAVARRLRLSGAEREYLDDFCAGIEGFVPIEDLQARHHWFYRHGGERYVELLLLHAAGGDSSSDDLRRQIASADSWRRPTFPLGGDDVLALGEAPGPRVGDLLQLVESWWVDSNFKPDRAACLVRLEAAVAGTEIKIDGRNQET